MQYEYDANKMPFSFQLQRRIMAVILLINVFCSLVAFDRIRRIEKLRLILGTFHSIKFLIQFSEISLQSKMEQYFRNFRKKRKTSGDKPNFRINSFRGFPFHLISLSEFSKFSVEQSAFQKFVPVSKFLDDQKALLDIWAMFFKSLSFYFG